MPRFASGDILVVTPQDADDPEALARAGQRCRFIKYARGSAGSEYAFVQFTSKGRAVAFRPADLTATEERVEVAS